MEPVPQLLELFFRIPVPEAAAVHEHDAGGNLPGLVRLVRTVSAHDGLAAHFPGQKLEYIAYRKNIGVDDNGPPPMSHQFWRHETQGRERLEVGHLPDAARASPEKGLSFLFLKKGKVLDVHDLHVEFVRVGRVAFQRVGGDQGTQPLPLVGLDKNFFVHQAALPASTTVAEDSFSV